MNSDEDIDNPEIIRDDGLGNNRRIKQKQRKDLRLNYDSDSSDEGSDGEIPKEKTEEDAEAENSDDDMFASDNEEKDEDTSKPQTAKNGEYLDIEQFEREEGLGEFDQEHQYLAPNNKEQDSDSETEPTEEPDEITARYYNDVENLETHAKVKTKKDPKIEAFSLKDEAEEGKFDLEGNFIRQEKDENEAEDAYFGDFKKSEIIKARKAQQKREELQKEREQDSSGKDLNTLLQDLIVELEPAETPLEALARLNPKKSKKSKKSEEVDSMEEKRKKVVGITELCTKLSQFEIIDDIYDMSREELMRLYKRETGNDFDQFKRGVKRVFEEDNEDQIDEGKKIWEFKWLGENDINGPYSTYEMSYWKETYFNNGVEVRKLGTEEFVLVEKVKFDV